MEDFAYKLADICWPAVVLVAALCTFTAAACSVKWFVELCFARWR